MLLYADIMKTCVIKFADPCLRLPVRRACAVARQAGIRSTQTGAMHRQARPLITIN